MTPGRKACSVFFQKEMFPIVELSFRKTFQLYYKEQLCGCARTAGRAGHVFNYTSPSVSSPADNCSGLIRIKKHSVTLKNVLMLVFLNPLYYLGQYEHHNFCLEVEVAVSCGHAHVLGSCFGKWHSPKCSPASVWLWCKAGNNIKGCYYVTAPMKGPDKTSRSWSRVPDWDLPEVTGGSVGGFG